MLLSKRMKSRPECDVKRALAESQFRHFSRPPGGVIESRAMETQPQPFQADPTENVKALSAASSRRLDDLHAALKELVLCEIRSVREIVARDATHAREVRELETARLRAIRDVDIGNQTVAAERSHAAILALERTTLASAQTLRDVVETSARALATQTAAAMSTVEQRIAALEKASYEGKGKESQTDPMLARLAEAVESLTTSRAATAGARGGAVASREWIGWVVGLLLAALSIAAYLAK